MLFYFLEGGGDGGRGTGTGDKISATPVKCNYPNCAATIYNICMHYLLSDLSKTGFHQNARGLYKSASQVTIKRLTVQLNKIINVQNHKYTTIDRYTTAANIKCTDNDIKHDET